MDWTGDDHYRFSGDYLGYVQPTEPLSEDAKLNVTVNSLCSE